MAIVTIVDWIKVANAINDANNALGSIGAGQIDGESGTFKFIMQIVFYVLVGFASISIFININSINDAYRVKFKSFNKKLFDLEDKIKNNN